MDITGANNSVNPGLLDALRDLGGRADTSVDPGASEAAPLEGIDAATESQADAVDPGETLLRLDVWEDAGEQPARLALWDGGTRVFGEPSADVPGEGGPDGLAQYIAGPLSD